MNIYKAFANIIQAIVISQNTPKTNDLEDAHVSYV